MTHDELTKRLHDGESPLELSIEKWDKLDFPYHITKEWFDDNCTSKTCGLCEVYYDVWGGVPMGANACIKCPIAIRCNNKTSYYSRLRQLAIAEDSIGFDKLRKEFVEYLKSLRPNVCKICGTKHNDNLSAEECCVRYQCRICNQKHILERTSKYCCAGALIRDTIDHLRVIYKDDVKINDISKANIKNVIENLLEIYPEPIQTVKDIGCTSIPYGSGSILAVPYSPIVIHSTPSDSVSYWYNNGSKNTMIP